MQEVKMTTKERVHMHFAPVGSDGQPAPIEGNITHTVEDGSDVTVDEGPGTDPQDGTPINNANPMFVSGDSARETKVTSKADADLGEGVKEISQEFSVITILPQAESFNVSMGSPQPKETAGTSDSKKK